MTERITSMSEHDGGVSRFSGLAGIIVPLLLALIVVWSSYYTIDQGERGVVLHWGAVVGESEPGLHFKYPLVTSVVDISVRQQNDGWTKVGDGDQRLEVYTKDQQPVWVSLHVLYHVTDPSVVYSSYASVEKLENNLINPQVPQQVKNVFGQFTAISAIQDRTQLDAEVSSAVKGAVHGPMRIDSVQISDIEYSNAYEQAVEARMQAIVAQQQAEAEKQKRITNADAAAYEVRAAADAQAHQIEVKGDAEADAIKKRGDALKENPEMPQLVAAEKWNGELPTTMPPNGALPFLNLGK